MQKFISNIILTIIFLSLTGCMVGPDFKKPPAPLVPGYDNKPMPAKTVSVKTTGNGGKAQYFVYGEDIPSAWWTIFHSPALNALINTGLNNSPTLVAAEAALIQARETLSAQIGTTLLPSIDASFTATRQSVSNQALTGLPNIPPSIFNLFNPILSVSYTLDVFGGERREIEALWAQMDYQKFQLEGAYLTLTSNIVTTAINVASLEAQIQATHDLIKAFSDQLNLINKQFTLGAASRANILTQETQLAQTEATLPPLEKQLAQQQHALAVLVGAFPSNIEIPHFDLDHLNLPTHLPVSCPSSLVQQRPDVRAAEELMHVASAQVGVATAAMFPTFNITGNYGWSSTEFNDIFNSSNLVWNLSGQIAQPLFHGGALNAQRKAAKAAYDQATAQYHQVVLQAFQNVADVLRALETDALELQAQRTAEVAARDSLTLITKQFRLGAASYLQLLTAQQQYQQARINRIKAQASRYVDTAALFQALGGGWWNKIKLPPPCCDKL